MRAQVEVEAKFKSGLHLVRTWTLTTPEILTWTAGRGRSPPPPPRAHQFDRGDCFHRAEAQTSRKENEEARGTMWLILAGIQLGALMSRGWSTNRHHNKVHPSCPQASHPKCDLKCDRNLSPSLIRVLGRIVSSSSARLRKAANADIEVHCGAS